MNDDTAPTWEEFARTFADHLANCDAQHGGECTCGFDAMLDDLEQHSEISVYWEFIVGTKVTLEMTGKQLKRLADYLESHESDIAHHLDDYQELEDLFEIVFESKPSKDV